MNFVEAQVLQQVSENSFKQSKRTAIITNDKTSIYTHEIVEKDVEKVRNRSIKFTDK
jgi:hypothetical protein